MRDGFYLVIIVVGFIWTANPSAVGRYLGQVYNAFEATTQRTKLDQKFRMQQFLIKNTPPEALPFLVEKMLEETANE